MRTCLRAVLSARWQRQQIHTAVPSNRHCFCGSNHFFCGLNDGQAHRGRQTDTGQKTSSAGSWEINQDVLQQEGDEYGRVKVRILTTCLQNTRCKLEEMWGSTLAPLPRTVRNGKNSFTPCATVRGTKKNMWFLSVDFLCRYYLKPSFTVCKSVLIRYLFY